MAKGESPDPFLKFAERLQKNPSFRSVQQLHGFLEHSNIPITKDGCFLAYKGVTSELKDKHSGKIDNHPGVVNEMPRNQVSDDPEVACHYGFHVGDLSYARGFASRTIVCKIDPADVVCVPKDSEQRKVRVCRYRVVGFYGDALPDSILDEPIVNVPIDVPEVKGTIVRSTATLTRKTEKGTETEIGAKVQHTHKRVPLAKKSKKDNKRLASYDEMDSKKLLDLSLDELREYATYRLLIVGASKVPGGKIALISKILAVRGKGE